MTEQLNDIIEAVYKPALKEDYNPRELTIYVLTYENYRKIGLRHEVAIQKLQMDYNLDYGGNKNV